MFNDISLLLLWKKIGKKNDGKTQARRTQIQNDRLRARRVADELERGKDV